MPKKDEENKIHYKYSPGKEIGDYIFEQASEGSYLVFSKTEKKFISLPDHSHFTEIHNYEVLPQLPWKSFGLPKEYTEEQLWNEVCNFILDHVFLPDERLYDVLTAWVLATWIRERWTVVPYLLMKGPISSGKTRLLEVLCSIAFRGIMASNISGAALFRASQEWSPTLFLDETEIYNKEQRNDVVGLLNAGYRRGQYAIRVKIAEGGHTELELFDVFGFKALAGTQGLAQALESRAIIIDMVKNQKRVNFRVNEERAEALRSMLIMYRLNKLSEMLTDGNDDFDDLQGKLGELKDGRLMELFYCLGKVANKGLENILSYANYMANVRESEGQASLEAQVLEALLKSKGKVNEGKILVKDVSETLNELLPEKEKFTTRFVTKMLSNLGFKKTHLEKGVGVVWDERMIKYRALQYKFIADTPSPPESSESSESSANIETMDVKRPSADETDETDETHRTPLSPPDISKHTPSIISLVRLTSSFEDKCFKCGMRGKMDYQANFADGTWGLLCESCGREMEKVWGLIE